MEQVFSNELKHVFPFGATVKNEGLIELSLATTDMELVGTQTTPIFFKRFESVQGKQTKEAVADEETYQRALDQIALFGYDVSELEKIAFDDDNVVAEMTKVAENLPSHAINLQQSNPDELPELYVSKNEKGEVSIGFNPQTIFADKLDATTSTYLDNVLDDEKFTTELVAVQENKLFGRFEFLFKLDVEGQEKILRITRILKKFNPEDKTETPTPFKVSYAPDKYFDKKVEAENDLSKIENQIVLKTLENGLKQGRATVISEFKRLFGRDIEEVIENKVPIQVRINKVENSGKKTAYITADNLEFLD